MSKLETMYRELGLLDSDVTFNVVTNGKLKPLQLLCPSCILDAVMENCEYPDKDEIKLSFDFLTHKFHCESCCYTYSSEEILELIEKFHCLIANDTLGLFIVASHTSV